MTFRNSIALSAICLACLMFGLEISSIPAILPTLQHVLGAHFQQMQWIMNAYTIAVTTVLMATGTLADRYGRKRVLIIAIASFGVTSLLCGMATNVAGLIAARFAQGMSGGAMLISQIAVLSHEFEGGHERAVAFGCWGVVFGVGLGFGPIIGGAIASLFGWQWVFLVHVPIAAAALGLTFAAVHESRNPAAGKVDVAGMVTMSASVFCLTFYITQGSALGFTSARALAMLGASGVALLLFIVAERKSKNAMFDFSVFRIRAFSGAIAGSVAMNTSYWPFMIYLPIWFQAGLGYDNFSAGLGLLAYTLPTLVVPPIAERLSLRWGASRVISLGLFTIGSGFLLMKAGSGVVQPSGLTMLPGCLVAGIGLGIANTPATNTSTGSVARERAGMASGIDMSARMISLAINIAVMGLLLSSGIEANLMRLEPPIASGHDLHAIAESIAAGLVIPGAELTTATMHEALAEGFQRVMSYGCAGAWLLAGIGLMLARLGHSAVHARPASCEQS